jgi:hypothetical protein
VGTDDLRQLQEIRNERLHRLRLLEKRQAIEGFHTPPEIIVEIDQTRKELGLVESVLSSPVSQETVDAIGSSGQYMALAHQIAVVAKYLGERMDRMDEVSYEWRTTERAARHEGQRLYRILLVLSILLSGAALIVALRGGA